jgi:predicted ester cyclase
MQRTRCNTLRERLNPGYMDCGHAQRRSHSMNELKEAVVAMFEGGWNHGDVNVFATRAADPMIFHYAGTKRSLSVHELGQIVQRWRAAFPDLRITVDEMISEGDIVATRTTFTGTHLGPWAGAHPTGRSITMVQTLFFRFESGMLVEVWELEDQIAFRKQLGLTES